MKPSKSTIKLPHSLNLGVIYPCQYGQCVLPLQSKQLIFLTLQLSQTAIQNGFFLLKQGAQQDQVQLQFPLKPKTPVNICIASYAKQLKTSTTFHGQLYLFQQNIVHKIKLFYRVQVPRISSLKLLKTPQKHNIYRVILNKAISSQTRIMLQNQQPYNISFQLSFLYQMGIQQKQYPFIMKIKNSSLKIKGNQSFVIFIGVQTNIGYKKQYKGMKKCVLRNVLCLKTQSQLFYTLPLEVVVTFVKEPK